MVATKMVDELTTVMLRNIPNKYSTEMLLKLVNSKGFEGKYDFFYLPMDFANKCGKGYCFINFRDPADAQKCSKAFDKFNQWVFKSVKVCAATFAVVQGLKNNCDKMRGSPVVTDPSIPDDFKPILIGENGSQTVLGRDTSRDGARSDNWKTGRDDLSMGHVLSPFAEEFVPGGVTKEDIRKMVVKISTRPRTTVNRLFEIVYDIQIKHNPERNIFPILLHIEGPLERQLLSIIHMAPGVELRLSGPPLHLVVGADSPEVFELGKRLIEDHLQSVYILFAKFALSHDVEDLHLKVRHFREKRPEVSYEVPMLSEPECEPQGETGSLVDSILRKYIDKLDSIEPPTTDTRSETVSHADSPRRSMADLAVVTQPYERYDDNLVVTPPQNVLRPADSRVNCSPNATYACKGFVDSRNESKFKQGYWRYDSKYSPAMDEKENPSEATTVSPHDEGLPLRSLSRTNTCEWLSAS